MVGKRHKDPLECVDDTEDVLRKYIAEGYTRAEMVDLLKLDFPGFLKKKTYIPWLFLVVGSLVEIFPCHIFAKSLTENIFAANLYMSGRYLSCPVLKRVKLS